MKNYLSALKPLLIGSVCCVLCACSTFFDKDNTPTPTPLAHFKPEVTPTQLWNVRATKGVDKDYLKLTPTLNNQFIVTASRNGTVTATNKQNGATAWSTDTHIEITAGPTSANDLTVVGGYKGDVLALNPNNGTIVWKSRVSSEILAPPAISNTSVLIKTVDGHVVALSTLDGHRLWHYKQTEPTLILSASSAPVIHNNGVIAGFANGALTKLSLNDGELQWQQTIAVPEGSFPIQRMVDIDADPIVFNQHIYAATYQGKIASLDPDNGHVIWTHDISSYSGTAADFDKIYVSDTQSHVWAFDAQNGNVLWRQTQLQARNLTAPVTMGNYVVVGDGEGYLHWLSKQDGHFIARINVDSSGILATPIVDHNILYVVTRDGHLAAYTIA